MQSNAMRLVRMRLKEGPQAPITVRKGLRSRETGMGGFADGGVVGLMTPGNIDLAKRPIVKNPDGSISTVRSMSFNDDGKEVLIPTVAADGRGILSNDDAIMQYRKSGQHLGMFDTPDNATAYAQSLHKGQDKMYAQPRYASGGAVPAFDPSKPFETVASSAPAFDASKPFEPAENSLTPSKSIADRVLSGAAKAVEPITSYPSTYTEMNKEAREQIGHGIDQMTAPEGNWWDAAKGAGNVALGAVNYVGSPINAALRTVVGKPLEENAGVPKEYSEFAAGLALPGVGLSKIGKIGSAAEKSAVPTAEAIRDAATAAYRSPEVAALKIHPKAMSIFGEEAAAALAKDGFDPLLSPKTFGLLEKATAVPDGVPFVTGTNVQTLRRMLGKAAESPDKTERAAAQIAQRKLDDFMAKLPENAVLEGDGAAASKALEDARGNYAAASRSDRFQEALGQAEKQAAKSGMGGNLENTTRQKIDAILNSPTKSRGLTDSEKSAMADYVKGNITRNGLRVVTKVLGGDNPLMAAIHAGMSFSTYGLSLAAPLTGFALKKINNAVSAKELTRIDELLRSRSPLAKETGEAVSNWAKNGGALIEQPTTQNATRFFSAAQLLGNKLKAAGVNANMPELMTPFQGPGTSQAESNQ